MLGKSCAFGNGTSGALLIYQIRPSSCQHPSSHDSISVSLMLRLPGLTLSP